MNSNSKAAATLGRVKSPAKTKAARANGTLGGRPRKDEVLGRWYERTGECKELVRTRRGTYLVTVNGQVRDARATIETDAAQELYDAAAYKIGQRPE